MLDEINTCFFGGYDRMDTMLYIQKLTDEIEALEIALENKNQGRDFAMPEPTPQHGLKSTTLGGLKKNEVDDYVAELLKHIKEVRDKF